MTQLIFAAALFVAIHLIAFGITDCRARLLEKYGKRNYHIGFSVASTVSLLWLFHAYMAAPYAATWGQLSWFKPIAALVMLVAFVLIAAGVRCPHHGGCAACGAAEDGSAPAAKSVFRITRHPIAWGLALWALLHLIANGDSKSLILFGALYGIAVAGSFSLDKKLQEKLGAQWDAYAAVTSNRPFQAIREKRNSLEWRSLLLEEIGIQRLAIALTAYVIVAWLHVKLLGVSPFV